MSHNGRQFVAEEVTRHETGGNVVMNSSTYSDGKHTYLVAGQESHCQLYNVNSILVTDEEIKGNNSHPINSNARQRKPKSKEKQTIIGTSRKV